MPKPTTSTFLPLLFFVVFFISCSGKSKNDQQVIEALQNSLQSSNTTINQSTEVLLKGLQDKTMDYCSKERGEVWFPKAKKIAEKTKDLYDFLEERKSKKKIQDSDYVLIVDKIIRFKQDILSVDPEIPEVFANSFQFINTFIWVLGGDTLKKDNFYKKNHTTSLVAILSMLQNEIKKIENKTIAFCNAHVGCHYGFDSYAAIVGQNSNYLSPGSTLEIMVGVGAFNKTGQPIITIDGKNVAVGEEGYLKYKMTTPKKPGKYNIPVRVKFFNQTTGKNEEFSHSVKYTVAKECDQ